MFKRFGIPALALAAALAVAAPTVTLAEGREGHWRGGERHEERFHRDFRRYDRDDWRFRGGDRDRFRFGIGVYAAPAPANGYYDQYGVWHAYGYYDQYGVYHPYGY